MNKVIEYKCKRLSRDAKDFYLSTQVKEVDSITSLEFLRCVSSNVPVLMKGANKDWTAMKKWKPSYFRKVLHEKMVNVAVTPTGYADAIAKTPSGKEYFVEPEARQMKMSGFLDILDAPADYPGVFYIQQQNSNLTSEFQEIMDDVPREIQFASQALNSKPVAVNFWMGDQRAITSMHKDPFENIYCVISGFKYFTLHPPTDRPWIPYKCYPKAKYCETAPGKFEIIPQVKDLGVCNNEENNTNALVSGTGSNSDLASLEVNGSNNLIPWICIDPMQPDYKNYPLYLNTTTVDVEVGPGDLLYIPSLWFHHVQQSHGCVAVNYWYDMEFDIKYVYSQFLESLLPPNKNAI